MPSPEDLARIIQSGNFTPSAPNNPAPQNDGGGSNVAQLRPIMRFEDYPQMLKILERDLGERALVSQLERFARPIRLEENVFAFEPTNEAPKNLHMKLAAALKTLTSRDWRVYLEEGGGQTIEEIRKIENDALLARVKKDPKVQNVFRLFPGARITNIRPPEENQNNQNIEGNRK